MSDNRPPLESTTNNREAYTPKEIVKTLSFKPQQIYNPNGKSALEHDTTYKLDYNEREIIPVKSFKPVPTKEKFSYPFEGISTTKESYTEKEILKTKSYKP
eukprot:Sdes_comp19526_c0_seq2m11107